MLVEVTGRVATIGRATPSIARHSVVMPMRRLAQGVRRRQARGSALW
jgi:hypothetical protein